MIPTLALVYDNNVFLGFNKEKKQTFTRGGNNIKAFLNSNSVLICNKKNHYLFENSHNTYDILELFVFLYPRALCAGTAKAIYQYLCQKLKYKPQHVDCEAQLIFLILDMIAQDVASLSHKAKIDLIQQVQFIALEGWNLSTFMLHMLGNDGEIIEGDALSIWNIIPEYQSDSSGKESLIDNNSSVTPINNHDIVKELSNAILLKNSRNRKEQEFYAITTGNIFQEVETNIKSSNDDIVSQHNILVKDQNKFYDNFNVDKNLLEQTKQVVFTEAGTGVGKTLGYLSAIVAFLKKNPKHQVLISTYTKALQKQIMAEFNYFFNNAIALKTANSKNQNNKASLKSTIIKGSGNYVCLLNFKNLVDNPGVLGKSSLFIATMARWLPVSDYGDIVGGDINPLAFDVFPSQFFNFLANKGEECIHSKCKYFKNCFVMKAKHLAKTSNVVISNHSYSLINNGMGIKYVLFDESHHLLNSADDIFAQDFSVLSLRRIRGWIQGYSGRASLAKASFNGIKSRISFILQDNHRTTEEEKLLNYNIENIIETLVSSCDILPNFDSLHRIQNNLAQGIFEDFLQDVYLQVTISNNDIKSFYNQEMFAHNATMDDRAQQNIVKLKAHLMQIKSLSSKLIMLLLEKINHTSLDDVKPIEEFIRVFEGIFYNSIINYIVMLDDLIINTKDDSFIYRFIVQKEEGQISNIGYYKNYLDPSKPMAQVIENTKGVCFTSATLTHSKDLPSYVNNTLIRRFGINYLSNYVLSAIKLVSPFNYKENSKIILINSHNRKSGNLPHIIRELFKASSGGGLAIFTAITRLKEVYHSISKEQGSHNLKIMAQHINDQKLVNLIDIFKEDINSCLLATDAARDGVDIPGNSLRLVVFEKIPWVKPDILMKEREKFFGKSYSEEITKLKLKQAFGRLIRTESDRGVFVLIDKALPTSLASSFPEDVEINYCNVDDSLLLIKKFLA